MALIADHVLISSILAISGEGAAAILGALVGGGIALLGQGFVALFAAWRGRRIAARVIFSELLANIAIVQPALDHAGWIARDRAQDVRHASWDIYGARLLRAWKGPREVGVIARAYDRVSQIAWLASIDSLSSDDYQAWMLDMVTGLYLVGRAAGYSHYEIEALTDPASSAGGFLDRARAKAEE